MADDSNLSIALQGVTQGLESLKQTLGGVTAGLQTLGGQAGMGIQGIGAMLPKSTFQSVPGMAMPRHGMSINDMSLGRDVGIMSGFSNPPMNAYAGDVREMAVRDISSRTGNFATQLAIHGAGAAASWYGGMAAFNTMGAMGWGAGVTGASSIGGALGAGLGLSGWGGIAGAAAVSMAATLPITMAVSKISQDVQEHVATSNYIRDSSFRYARGTGGDIDPRYGSGFSATASGKIAREIKSLSIEDMSLDMGDMSGILDRGTQYGLFRGSNTTESFMSKFKELTTSVKQVSRALKVSLDEGMRVISELDQAGITGPSAISKFVRSADTLGAASGMTGAEMYGIGQTGIAMARGSGINMGAGATMLMNNTATTSVMFQQGMISAETVAQAGGATQLAQGITQKQMGIVNDPMMNAMMGAAGNTGGMNSNVMQAMLSGAGPGALMSAAMGGLGSPGQFMSAYVNREKNIQELSKAFGGQGLEAASMMSAVSYAKLYQAYGADKETALKYAFMQNQGMTDPEATTMIGKMKNFDKIQAGLDEQKAYGQMREKRDDLIRNHGAWALAKRQVGRAWDAAVGEPVATASTGIQAAFEGFGRAIDDADIALGEWVTGTESIRPVVYSKQMDQNIHNRVMSQISSTVMGGNDIGFEASRFKKSKGYNNFLKTNSGALSSEAFLGAKNADQASHAMFGVDFYRATTEQKIQIAAAVGPNSAAYGDVEKQWNNTQQGGLLSGYKGRSMTVQELHDEQKIGLDAEAKLKFQSGEIGRLLSNERTAGAVKDLVTMRLDTDGFQKTLTGLTQGDNPLLTKEQGAAIVKQMKSQGGAKDELSLYGIAQGKKEMVGTGAAMIGVKSYAGALTATLEKKGLSTQEMADVATGLAAMDATVHGGKYTGKTEEAIGRLATITGDTDIKKALNDAHGEHGDPKTAFTGLYAKKGEEIAKSGAVSVKEMTPAEKKAAEDALANNTSILSQQLKNVIDYYWDRGFPPPQPPR